MAAARPDRDRAPGGGACERGPRSAGHQHLAGDPGLLRFRAEMERAMRVLFALADEYGIPPEDVAAAFDRFPLERTQLGVGA
jgi:hypothetical protein